MSIHVEILGAVLITPFWPPQSSGSRLNTEYYVDYSEGGFPTIPIVQRRDEYPSY